MTGLDVVFCIVGLFKRKVKLLIEIGFKYFINLLLSCLACNLLHAIKSRVFNFKSKHDAYRHRLNCAWFIAYNTIQNIKKRKNRKTKNVMRFQKILFKM